MSGNPDAAIFVSLCTSLYPLSKTFHGVFMANYLWLLLTRIIVSGSL